MGIMGRYIEDGIYKICKNRSIYINGGSKENFANLQLYLIIQNSTIRSKI